jgi:hypothetical protein
VQDFPALTVRNVLKILWLADVCKYVDRCDSVSGATYVRGTYGPVPTELETLLQEEEQNHIINSKRRIIFSFACNDSLISVTDAQYIDYWIQRIAYLPTCRDRISESLDFAWKIALFGEQIPLYAVLANRICTPEIEDVRATAFTPHRHRHTLWTLAEHPTVRNVIETAS